MINPLDLQPDTKPSTRANFQRRWDKKQARIKKDELHELDMLLARTENQMVLSPSQKQRVLVLVEKHKDEESPA